MVEQPLLFCRGPLREAFAAPSIPFEPGVRWAWPGSGPPETPSENAVLRDAAELKAFAARHGAPGEALEAALKVDWAAQQVLAVWTSAKTEGSMFEGPEIVAVSETPDGLTVHPVLWATRMPGWGPGAMHLVAVPRSDKPVRFLPPGRGYSEIQRFFLRPEWGQRHPTEVHAP